MQAWCQLQFSYGINLANMRLKNSAKNAKPISYCNCYVSETINILRFWCNYYDKKVPPLPRFNVEITDESGLIPATIFVEKAEQLYNITAPEMVNNTIDGNLSVEIIQKLSTPIKWAIMLRASMYTYGTIS